MKDLIKKLVESVGPSGFETAVRDLIGSEIKDLADEIHVDALGNLVARKGSKGTDGKRIMLSAHMDEIGVMATHIDEKGFVRFTTLGGVRPHTCYGSRVRFVNGVGGMIGGERLEAADKVHTFEQLYIDVGATNRANCPIHVGDAGVFDRPMLDLGDRIISKAMDNRISCAVLIETLRRLQDTPNEVIFVFSTQEEVGLRGATTAAYAVDPEIGISVDVTGVGDTPRASRMEVSLGQGPTVKVRDGGMISDPRLVRFMADSAEKAGIPYQLEILEGGTTDARAMQISRAGMPASCVSIPTRYIHSPSEMVDYNDVLNAVKLLIELISHPIQLP